MAAFSNYLSFFLGRLAWIPLPRFLADFIISLFSLAYPVRRDEAVEPDGGFRSLGEFFVRDLKPGSRPIGSGIVSPVDGRLRELGRVEQGRLPQVKGRTYSVEELLGDRDEALRFQSGTFINVYLAPPDYHHVHAPVSGSILKLAYVPGYLWPVNNWALDTVDRLFAVNERVIIFIDTAEYGRVAVVMVGALNVGKMTLTFDPLMTNRLRSAPFSREVSPVKIEKGARLGTFHLGSSVVVLFESSPTLESMRAQVSSGDKLTFGQTLLEKN